VRVHVTNEPHNLFVRTERTPQERYEFPPVKSGRITNLTAAHFLLFLALALSRTQCYLVGDWYLASLIYCYYWELIAME
jgi:hypothetical protein